MKDSSVLQPEGSKDIAPATPKKVVVPRRITSDAIRNTPDHGPAQPQSGSRLNMMRRAASELAAQQTAKAPAETPKAKAVDTAQQYFEAAETPKADPEVINTPSQRRPREKMEPSRALVSYDTWQDLQRISLGARLDGQPAKRGLPSLIEYFRADPIAKGFDLLRTRLVRTIRAYGWRKIAVVAPTPGCGATFTAVNLALSMSRVPGSRTVLMDMNQRAPGVADALGVRTANRLDEFLQAKTRLEDYFLCPSKTLAVGLADAPSAFAAEVLHDPLSEEVLDDMIDRLNPNLVIYDMPAMLSYDDMTAFMPQVDAVLLVVDGTQTLPDHISACERLFEGQTKLLGVVLNRGRSDSDANIVV